ncbi:MAG TPA: hypothetical protein VFT56_13980 [Sphingomonas sp.]|nr:hypothetical protein [Sphingomonas sp.]
MMRPIAFPLLTLAAVALLGTAAARNDDKVPAAVPDGKPLECLQTTQIRDTQVRSNQVIDFVTNGGKVYRNTLDTPCPQLGYEKRFSHKSPLDQYCSTDTITVLLNQGGLRPGATCGLGQFQPVKLVKH